jgi:iron(II)-dependent oxidoreductase
MASTARQEPPCLLSAAEALEALADARQRTLSLVAPVSDCDLERSHSPLMSPLVWDLCHIAAYEELWLVHRHAGRPLLHPEWAATFDAFETPRGVRGDLNLLGRADALAYLEAVRGRATEAMARLGTGDGFVHEMVLRHELQHNETMLQTLCLARLPGYRLATAGPAPRAPGGHSGLETVEVPAGPFAMGAPAERFAFDNERPCHPVSVRAFRIGRTAVTNATWLSFAEGGGYERREWWSDEGWAWKEEYDIERPGGWQTDLQETSQRPGVTTREAPLLKGRPVYEWRLDGAEPLDPDKPVVHVSWFEADAFARAHGVRLPTEAEWERAATWDQHGRRSLADRSPGLTTATRANLLESGVGGTVPVGAYPDSAAPCGALGMIGDVWEWTSSPFGGYPGFAAHPYPQYSAVFFGDAYRVLRGGSWASSARVAGATFRNWDLPQRRQIFAGVRIASEA